MDAGFDKIWRLAGAYEGALQILPTMKPQEN